jgi:hypothetical protein
MGKQSFIMSSNIMPEQDAIISHLTNISTIQNMTYFSGFVAGLRDARKFTKRNQDTGQKLGQDPCGNHGSWLGAIGYLSLLDQIGKCFKPRASARINEGISIKRALGYFSNLTAIEIDVVYALRNAFAHDYSLFNNPTNRPNLIHHFTVVQSPTEALITLPNSPWNGIPSDMSANNVTRMNLEALGDLVETICAQLMGLAQNDGLEILLAGGSDELIQRYSFFSM